MDEDKDEDHSAMKDENMQVSSILSETGSRRGGGVDGKDDCSDPILSVEKLNSQQQVRGPPCQPTAGR